MVFKMVSEDAASPTVRYAVYAYDSRPSTGSFPWNLFSTQIAAAAMSDLGGPLTAVASKSGGSWQVTLFSYDRDGRPALIWRSRGGVSKRSRPWPTGVAEAADPHRMASLDRGNLGRAYNGGNRQADLLVAAASEMSPGHLRLAALVIMTTHKREPPSPSPPRETTSAGLC
jgi:hypothetical protein